MRDEGFVNRNMTSLDSPLRSQKPTPFRAKARMCKKGSFMNPSITASRKLCRTLNFAPTSKHSDVKHTLLRWRLVSEVARRNEGGKKGGERARSGQSTTTSEKSLSMW